MNLPTKEEINPGIEKSLKELVEISQKIDFSKENQDIKDAMSLFFNSQIDSLIFKGKLLKCHSISIL